MTKETEHPLVRTLAARMSDISEECYCSTWDTRLEFILWEAVLNGPVSYGQGYISQEVIDELKALSVIIRGWVYYDEKDWNGETFIPLDEWVKKFAAYCSRYPEILADRARRRATNNDA